MTVYQYTIDLDNYRDDLESAPGDDEEKRVGDEEEEKAGWSFRLIADRSRSRRFSGRVGLLYPILPFAHPPLSPILAGSALCAAPTLASKPATFRSTWSRSPSPRLTLAESGPGFDTFSKL